MRTYHFLFVFIWMFVLSSCTNVATNVKEEKTSVVKKNLAYNAVLSDPVIKKDFIEFKKIIRSANLISKDNAATFSTADMQKIANASDKLLDRLENHYHLDQYNHRVYTFIGENKLHSCYWYYHSLKRSFIGKSCQALSSSYGNCRQCADFIEILKNRKQRIIHFKGVNQRDTTAMIDTFRLKNGTPVFVGLAIS